MFILWQKQKVESRKQGPLKLKSGACQLLYTPLVFRGLFPSPRLSPSYLISVLQSQRDCVLQPRVAPAPPKLPSDGGRNELPWVEGRTLSNPERVPATAQNKHEGRGDRKERI